MTEAFKLTYSTMFNPPAELHANFDAALARVKARLGADHPMWIGGRPRAGATRFEVRSPIDRDWLLATFPAGSAADVDDAVAAARHAFPAWRSLPWTERVRLLRRAAALIEDRVYDIAAAVALEVGKNRMEALGEVQETADLINWYCDQMQANDGFVRTLPNDPLVGFVSRNRTVLKPYGVWAVIAPFNFPYALAGGPVGAALVTGNTVVFKLASDTAWSGWLLMEVLRDAGLPDGVVNYVTGAGATVGQALVEHPAVDGVTFTGSSCRSCAPPRSVPGRGPASPRWAARTPRSSPGTRIWIAPRSASCARRSVCRGRSARRARACMWRSRSRRRCATSWWR
jgi:1-pyrroline-5-carboxylate dehydrogenase